MAGKLRLKVITPAKVKVDAEADMVVALCLGGDMGVLPGHMPLSAMLDIGALRIINGGAEEKLAVYGGFISIKNDVVTIVTREADWPDEIDVASALEERERVEQRARDIVDDIELQNDQILLRRALVQIEIGTSPFADRDD
jgi:F-type H+-transporting ATPase subunit epsilon